MTQKISFDAARQSQFSPVVARIAADMGGRVSADSIIDLFAAVESRIFTQGVKPLLYRTLVPVNTTQRPWADSILFMIAGKVGGTNHGEGSSKTAIRRVQTVFKDTNIDVFRDTVSYEYTKHELDQVSHFGGQLDSRSASNAMLAAEQTINNIMLYGWGDGNEKHSGLFNSSDVDVLSLTTGWLNADGSANAKAILGAINLGISRIMSYTGGDLPSMPDTMPLPTAAISVMGDPVNDGSSVSIMEYVSKNNIATLMSGKPLKFYAAPGLDTLGTNGRSLLYANSDDFVYGALPEALNFIAPQYDGMKTTVPGQFACTGATFVRPETAVYVDGILSAATSSVQGVKLNAQGMERVEALKEGADAAAS